MGIHHLSDLNPDGTLMGQSTSDKIAFYGKTTVVQPATASQDAVTGTATTAVTTTATVTTAAHGFATGTQADAVVKRVGQLQVDVAAVVVLTNQLRSDLTPLGLIKGAV